MWILVQNKVKIVTYHNHSCVEERPQQLFPERQYELVELIILVQIRPVPGSIPGRIVRQKGRVQLTITFNWHDLTSSTVSSSSGQRTLLTHLHLNTSLNVRTGDYKYSFLVLDIKFVIIISTKILYIDIYSLGKFAADVVNSVEVMIALLLGKPVKEKKHVSNRLRMINMF